MEEGIEPGLDCCCGSGATINSEKPGGTGCPNCGVEGQKVKNITVRSMVLDNLIENVGDQDFFFCRTPDCPVVYFDSISGRRFDKHDVKVRVWLKETEDPIPVCYCNEVTEKEILDEILKNGCPPALEEIQKRTGAGKGGKCLTRNPSGRCCHPAIKAVLQKGRRCLRRRAIYDIPRRRRSEGYNHPVEPY